jgi:hypothetical protein
LKEYIAIGITQIDQLLIILGYCSKKGALGGFGQKRVNHFRTLKIAM